MASADTGCSDHFADNKSDKNKQHLTMRKDYRYHVRIGHYHYLATWLPGTFLVLRVEVESDRHDVQVCVRMYGLQKISIPQISSPWQALSHLTRMSHVGGCLFFCLLSCSLLVVLPLYCYCWQLLFSSLMRAGFLSVHIQHTRSSVKRFVFIVACNEPQEILVHTWYEIYGRIILHRNAVRD